MSGFTYESIGHKQQKVLKMKVCEIELSSINSVNESAHCESSVHKQQRKLRIRVCEMKLLFTKVVNGCKTHGEAPFTKSKLANDM